MVSLYTFRQWEKGGLIKAIRMLSGAEQRYGLPKYKTAIQKDQDLSVLAAVIFTTA
ncbi:hypothetical protein [Thermosynechococcus sp.]|uniref:hypothetical protein n=1 Tax=Thermosynechococcus sp. TaxID=2814275 RepID=UPI00391C8040